MNGRGWVQKVWKGMLKGRGWFPIFLYCLLFISPYFSAMPLFQQSVLKKYLDDIDSLNLETEWVSFAHHFLDPVKQANIRNLTPRVIGAHCAELM